MCGQAIWVLSRNDALRWKGEAVGHGRALGLRALTGAISILLGNRAFEELRPGLVGAGLVGQQSLFFNPHITCSGQGRAGRLVLGMEDRVVGNFHIIAELGIEIQTGVVG
jgi:hypothetical protein